jgi:hypothetical protein
VTQEPPQDHPIVVKLFGRSGSAAAYAIRDFLQRSDVPFEWHRLDLSNEEECTEKITCSGDRCHQVKLLTHALER